MTGLSTQRAALPLRIGEKRLKILVTGGAGFIGSNFVRLALSSGHDVSVLDDLSVGDRRYLENLPLRFVQGNILDEDLVRKEVGSS